MGGCKTLNGTIGNRGCSKNFLKIQNDKIEARKGYVIRNDTTYILWIKISNTDDEKFR